MILMGRMRENFCLGFQWKSNNTNQELTIQAHSVHYCFSMNVYVSIAFCCLASYSVKINFLWTARSLSPIVRSIIGQRPGLSKACAFENSPSKLHS